MDSSVYALVSEFVCLCFGRRIQLSTLRSMGSSVHASVGGFICPCFRQRIRLSMLRSANPSGYTLVRGFVCLCFGYCIRLTIFRSTDSLIYTSVGGFVWLRFGQWIRLLHYSQWVRLSTLQLIASFVYLFVSALISAAQRERQSLTRLRQRESSQSLLFGVVLAIWCGFSKNSVWF
jgi:hypothetical protein